MKRIALKTMQTAGLFAAFRWLNRRGALILMYHRFSENAHPGRVSREQLTAHLEYLRKHYRVLPLKEIAARLQRGDNLPPNTAAITIDDGYSDVYDIAFPVFKKFDAPATLFVITDFLDRKAWLWTDKTRYLTANTARQKIETKINDKEFRFELNGYHSRLISAGKLNETLKKLPDAEKERQISCLQKVFEVEIPFLPPAEFGAIDWSAAREMDAANVQIESHTVTHPILTKIDAAQLEFELQESRRRASEELRREVNLFCYPNGSYTERECRAVEKAGYQAAVTTNLGFNETGANLYELNRIDAQPQITDFLQYTSGFETAKNKARSFIFK
jgi:peptidoglycan/xylan/chitin deacetylase (PgdA/CDA1 family)